VRKRWHSPHAMLLGFNDEELNFYTPSITWRLPEKKGLRVAGTFEVIIIKRKKPLTTDFSRTEQPEVGGSACGVEAERLG
jgi:hypothetical protein